VERRDTGEPIWISDFSRAKSLECGCEYCDAACKVMGEAGLIEENMERNRNASASNAELTFEKRFADRTIQPRLKPSGIGFLRGAEMKELFVLDRKSAYSSYAQATNAREQAQTTRCSRLQHLSPEIHARRQLSRPLWDGLRHA
jgi:hypothetical protein